MIISGKCPSDKTCAASPSRMGALSIGGRRISATDIRLRRGHTYRYFRSIILFLIMLIIVIIIPTFVKIHHFLQF